MFEHYKRNLMFVAIVERNDNLSYEENIRGSNDVDVGAKNHVGELENDYNLKG